MSTRSQGIVFRTFRSYSIIFLLKLSFSHLKFSTFNIKDEPIYSGMAHCSQKRIQGNTLQRMKDVMHSVRIKRLCIIMFPFLKLGRRHTRLRHNPRHALLVCLLVYDHGGGVIPVNNLGTCISSLVSKEYLYIIFPLNNFYVKQVEEKHTLLSVIFNFPRQLVYYQVHF